MNHLEILRHRLVNQHLIGSRWQQPEQVVTGLVALQAQEFAMARWAIGLRAPGVHDAAVESAFNAGKILRTHLLRTTWHFVSPADIRWLLALTASRGKALMGTMDRKLGVDAATLKRSHVVVTRALAGGKRLTRDELRLALIRARITKPEGQRLAHLLMHAELDGLICSGPRKGRRFTYALLDERAAPVPPRTQDEALAELAQRYFSSRGPATAYDFATWSGLTVTEARRGIDTLGSDFARISTSGKTYLLSARTSIIRPRNLPTFLMPDYDEYGMSYKDRSAMVGRSDPAIDPPAFNRMIIVAGRLAGSWRRTDAGEAVQVEAILDAPLAAGKQRALLRAARDYGVFLGRKVLLQTHLRDSWKPGGRENKGELYLD